MRWHRRALDTDRRRRLLALSRFEATPKQRVIELNAEGTDYVCLGDLAEVEFADHWRLLQSLLSQAARKLNRSEILAGWPAEARPDATTVYRWLRRAVELGLVRQDGLGQHHHPFRYWLPESEDRWRNDPFSLILMPELIQPLTDEEE